MIKKPLDQINKADVESLVENEVAEGKTIDYKLELPGGSDGQKKEFLADVTSFVNSGGGDIVYGIRERIDGEGKNTGIPEEAVGLPNVNLDQETLRLESSIREGISNRIPGVQPLKRIDGFPNGSVCILRIPKSWAGPHMVTFQNSSRFYTRASNGRYQMDVNEIRIAFLQSEILEEKMKKFRDDRIKCIKDLKSPILYPNSSLTLLHLIPFSFLDPEMRIDLPSTIISENYRSLGTYCNNYRYNIDGFLKTSTESSVYLQFFNTGVIEAASPELIRGSDKDKSFNSIGFERTLINSTRDYFAFYRNREVSPPAVLFLTLLNVNGFYLEGNRRNSIDRDDILFPEILIKDFSQDPSKVLRSLFDMVCRACGYAKSFNYDDDGNWTGDR